MTTQAAHVEATEVSKAILRRVHPDAKEIPAAQAMHDVEQVLGLERGLRAAAEKCQPGDWRAIAAELYRQIKAAPQ